MSKLARTSNLAARERPPGARGAHQLDATAPKQLSDDGSGFFGRVRYGVNHPDEIEKRDRSHTRFSSHRLCIASGDIATARCMPARTSTLRTWLVRRCRLARFFGLVETEQERSEAEHLTRATEGVRGVENEIRIGDLGFGQHVSDGWILTKIRSRLTVDPEVESFNIDVDVLDGDVTLSGLVTTERVREEAARIARATDGVRSVRNRIEVR
jgi:hypothetical protein